MKERLTKRYVDTIVYQGDGKSQDIRWDESLANFGVRVYPSNRKSYVVFFRINNRSHLMALGSCETLTLKQARDKAKEHLSSIRLRCNDPLQERKDARQGEKVKDLARLYLNRYAKLHKKTWQEDERRLNKHIIPRWGNMMAANVTHSDVAKLHWEIGAKTPYEGNRIVELLGKMFELARTWGLVPADHRNPAAGIEHYREKKRDRWVTPEELPKLARAIDQEQNVYARGAIWVLALTGARKSELLKAKWTDIDFARAELRIPESKTGQTRYVLLSPPALAVLETIPQVANNPYVFIGRNEGRHLVNLHKPWRRICKAADIDGARIHDLRLTVGSWLAQSGNSLALIGHVLGHSNTSTTQIYSRFAKDSAREAIDAYGTRLMGIAGKSNDTPPARVMELKK